MTKQTALIPVLALLAALSASAQDATLAKVSGPVFLVAGGKSYPAKGGEELIFGDAVRVGAGGVAQLVLPERGAVLVREDSVLTLKGSTRRTLLDFARGEFLVGLSKRLRRGQSFKVRTPAAVAAVRGTLFWGKSDKDKTTTYAGFGHEIAVTAKGKTVVVKAGETVTVPFGVEPSTPTASQIPVDYVKNFAVDGGLQGLEKLVALPAPAKK
jgi:hypothetical protein